MVELYFQVSFLIWVLDLFSFKISFTEHIIISSQPIKTDKFRDYGEKSSLTSSKLIIWDNFIIISFGRGLG